MLECSVCGKEVSEGKLITCSECGRAYCERCAGENPSMSALGVCSNCEEFWDSEDDLDAEG